jgi:hypothetical protein
MPRIYVTPFHRLVLWVGIELTSRSTCLLGYTSPTGFGVSTCQRFQSVPPCSHPLLSGSCPASYLGTWSVAQHMSCHENAKKRRFHGWTNPCLSMHKLSLNSIFCSCPCQSFGQSGCVQQSCMLLHLTCRQYFLLINWLFIIVDKFGGEPRVLQLALFLTGNTARGRYSPSHQASESYHRCWLDYWEELKAELQVSVL